MNDNTEIIFVDDRFGHDRRYSLEIGKVMKDFNWKIENDFIISLTNYIKNIK